MEEFLFLVHPIWWEGKILTTDIILFLCIGIFWYYFGKYISNRLNDREKQPIKKRPIFHPRDIQSASYESDTLKELKWMIEFFYNPKNTSSHTVKEIGTYLFESDILKIANILESSIYQWIPLRADIRREINTSIERFCTKTSDFL